MKNNYSLTDMEDYLNLTPRDELHELVDALDDTMLGEARLLLLETMGK